MKSGFSGVDSHTRTRLAWLQVSELATLFAEFISPQKCTLSVL